MNARWLCCAGALLFAWGLSKTQAQTVRIVDFGGTDYVTSNQKYRNNSDGALVMGDFGLGTPGPNDARRQYAFSPAIELNPQAAGYDQTQPSAEFYGGIQGTRADTNSASFGTRTVNNNSAGDRISLRHQTNSGAAPQPIGNTHLFVFWDKTGFLNGGDSQTMEFDAASSLNVAMTRHENLTSRFVVRDGTTFYISQQTFTGTAMLNPNATDWAVYDPATDLDFDAGAATFASHTFTDITAAGVYSERDAVCTCRMWFELSDFEVDAVVAVVDPPDPGGGSGSGFPIDLAVGKSHSNTTSGATLAAAGEVIQYAIDFVNLGTDTATNGVICDTLPTGLTLDSGSIVVPDSVTQTTVTATEIKFYIDSLGGGSTSLSASTAAELGAPSTGASYPRSPTIVTIDTDFESGVPGWDQFASPDSNDDGNWVSQALGPFGTGNALQQDNCDLDSGHTGGLATPGAFISPPVIFGSFTAEFDFHMGATGSTFDDAAFIFGLQNNANYWMLNFNENGGSSDLILIQNDHRVEQDQDTQYMVAGFGPFVAGTTYHVEVIRDICANSLRVLVDDAEVFNLSLPGLETFAEGRIALGSLNDCPSFDNLTITGPAFTGSDTCDPTFPATFGGNGAIGPVETDHDDIPAEADAYGQGNQENNNFNNSVLRIKRESVPTGNTNQNNRKSWMRFNTAASRYVPGTPVVGAELGLTFVDNGIGGSTAGTTWSFDVYGLNDGDTGESWDETTLTWNNAPGNDTGSNRDMDGARMTYLGSFEVQDRGTGLQRFSSPQLDAFIAADTDNQLTIGIARRGAQRSGTGQTIVHEIASSETATPPNLRLPYYELIHTSGTFTKPPDAAWLDLDLDLPMGGYDMITVEILDGGGAPLLPPVMGQTSIDLSGVPAGADTIQVRITADANTDATAIIAAIDASYSTAESMAERITYNMTVNDCECFQIQRNTVTIDSDGTDGNPFNNEAFTDVFLASTDREPPKVTRIHQGGSLGCVPDGMDAMALVAAEAPLDADLASVMASDSCGGATPDMASTNVAFQEGVEPTAGYAADSIYIRSGAGGAGSNQNGDGDFENIVGRVGSADALRGLYEFDLSAIAAAAPCGDAVIESISLVQTTRPRDLGSGQGAAFMADLLAYDFDFDETTATWNTPAPGDGTPGGTLGTVLTSVLLNPTTPGSSAVTIPSSAGFVAAANAALAAPDQTLRMLLKAQVETGGGNQFIAFRNDEWATAAQRPRLEVTFRRSLAPCADPDECIPTVTHWCDTYHSNAVACNAISDDIHIGNTAQIADDFDGAGAVGTVPGFAVADNPHRYLVVAVAGEQSGPPSSVEYGGQALTMIASGTEGVSHASVWALADPPVGSADVEVTQAGPNGCRFGVVELFSAQPFGISGSDSAAGAGAGNPVLSYGGISGSGVFVTASEKNSDTTFTSEGTVLFNGGGVGGYGGRGNYGELTGPIANVTNVFSFGTRHAAAGVLFHAAPPSNISHMERKFKVTDCCSNVTVASIVYTFNDEVPVITNVEAGAYLGCRPAGYVPSPAPDEVLLLGDVVDPDNLSVTDNVITNTENCEVTVERTYRYETCCGLFDERRVYFTYSEEPPLFGTGPFADIDLGCIADVDQIPPLDLTMIAASNHCGVVNVTKVSVSDPTPVGDGCTVEIERCFRVETICGITYGIPRPGEVSIMEDFEGADPGWNVRVPGSGFTPTFAGSLNEADGIGLGPGSNGHFVPGGFVLVNDSVVNFSGSYEFQLDNNGNFDDVVFVFNYQDDANFYYILLSENGGRVGLYSVVGGVINKTSFAGNPTVPDDEVHQLQISYDASTGDLMLTVTRNNGTSFSYNNPNYNPAGFTGGSFGFGSLNDSFTVDNVAFAGSTDGSIPVSALGIDSVCQRVRYVLNNAAPEVVSVPPATNFGCQSASFQIPATAFMHSTGGQIDSLALDGGRCLDFMTVTRGNAGQINYTTRELIGVDLIDFDASNGSRVNIIAPMGDPVVPFGQRAAMIEDDCFDTGVINPTTTDDMSMHFRFDAPVVNSAGPDIVFFEIDNNTPRDPIVVTIPGFGPAQTLNNYGGRLTGDLALQTQEFTPTTPASLNDLETMTLVVQNSNVGGQGIHGLGIDLNDFGVAPGASITELFLRAGSTGERVDPVFIAGLPEIQVDQVVVANASGLFVEDSYVTNGCEVTATRAYIATNCCGDFDRREVSHTFTVRPDALSVQAIAPLDLGCIQTLDVVPSPSALLVTASSSCSVVEIEWLGDNPPYMTLIAPGIRNGGFENEADGGATDALNFSEVANWYSFTGVDQQASRTNLEFPGGDDRNGVLNAVGTRQFANDTGVSPQVGDTIDLSLWWRDAFSWTDTGANADRLVADIYVGGVLLTTFMTPDSTMNSTYERASWSYTVQPGDPTGPLTLVIHGQDGGGGGFARFDNVTLAVGMPEAFCETVVMERLYQVTDLCGSNVVVTQEISYILDTTTPRIVSVAPYEHFGCVEPVPTMAAPPAPVVALPFDEGSGASTADTEGGDQNGTLQNGAFWSAPGADGAGAAVCFDGNDDTVTLTGYKGITGTGARTVSAWVRSSSSGNQGIVAWGLDNPAPAGQKMTFRINDNGGNGTQGAIRAEVNGGYIIGSTAVADGNWHHVAYTWTPSANPNIIDAKLYVDGLPEAISGSRSQSMNTAAGIDVRIGRTVNGNSMNGCIDQVGIYDRALSPADILALAGAALPGTVPAPVASWRMEEGQGGTTADDIGGNDGTLVGGAAWTAVDVAPAAAGSTAAIQFDGVDDQINMLGYKGVTGTNPRSMSAWIRTASTSPNQDMSIMSWGNNSGGQKWNFRIQQGAGRPGTIRVEVNGGYIVGATVVTDGQWHHVAATWENDGSPNVNDVKLYVDGQPEGYSAVLARSINTASGKDVQIGRDHSNRRFNGWIDEAAIFDRALTAPEIAVLAMPAVLPGGTYADPRPLPVSDAMVVTTNATMHELAMELAITNGCEVSVTRTWRAEDCCGDFDLKTEQYGYTLAPLALMATAPESFHIHCITHSNQVPPAVPALVRAMAVYPNGINSCEPVVDWLGDLVASNSPDRCTTWLDRVYRVSDSCNTTNLLVTQQIAYTLSLIPEITALPTNIHYGCTNMVPVFPDPLDGFAAVNAIITNVSTNTFATNGCEISATVHYEIENCCGLTDEGTVTYTWTAEPEPPILHGEELIALGCIESLGQIPVPHTSQFRVDAECGAVVEWVTNTPFQVSFCHAIFTNIYRATDLCGGTTMFHQAISFTLENPPEIILDFGVPPVIDLGCQLAGTTPVEVTTLDWSITTILNRGIPPVPPPFSFPPGVSAFSNSWVTVVTNGCLVEATRIFEVADCCHNRDQIEQKFTWRLLPDIFLGEVETLDLGCIGGTNEIPPAAVTISSFTADCGIISARVAGEFGFTNTLCSGAVWRVYEIEDPCGQVAVTTQQIVWVNGGEPEIQMVEIGQDWGCQDADYVPPVNSNMFMFTNAVTNNWTDKRSVSGCVATVQRTFRVENCCGEVDTRVVQHTYTIRPNDPTIEELAPKYVGCIAHTNQVPEPNITLVAASSSCAIATIRYLHDTNTLVADNNGGLGDANLLHPCTSYISRVYEATDLCGQAVLVTQVVSWTLDDSDPEFVALPPGTNYGCVTSAPALPAPWDGFVGTNYVDSNVVGVLDTSDPCRHTMTRTYTLWDCCGDSAEELRVFSWTPTPALPTVLGVRWIDLGCLADPGQVPQPSTGQFLVQSACGAGIAHVSNSLVEATGGCGFEQRHYYEATDGCGQTAPFTQTFVWVEDTVAPKFSIVPGGDLGCDPLVPTPEQDMFSLRIGVIENCSHTVMPFGVEEVIDDGCRVTLTRRYMVRDDCDNSDVAAVTYTWAKKPAPPIVTGPTNLVVGCVPSAAQVPQPNAAELLVRAVCGHQPVEWMGDGPHRPDINGCDISFERAWRVLDHCGGVDWFTQTVHYVIETGARIVAVPAPVDFGCLNSPPSLPPPGLGLVTTGTIVLSEVEDLRTTNDCDVTLVRHYYVEDCCGNFDRATTTYTWRQAPSAPELIGPSSIDLGCIDAIGQIPVPHTSQFVADAGCGATITHLTNADTTVIVDNCRSRLTRIYEVVDGCSQTSRFPQSFTYVLNETPVRITGTETGQAWSCLAADPTLPPALSNVTFVGNAIVLRADDERTTNGCDVVHTRTYYIEDCCGNFDRATVEWSWSVPASAPTLSGPDTLALGCLADVGQIPVPNTGQLTLDGGCDAQAWFVSNSTTNVAGCLATFTRTYRAADRCGQSDEFIQTITYSLDNVPPVITGTEDPRHLGCLTAAPALPADYDALTWTGDVVASNHSDSVWTNGCEITLLRTYSVTDCCGNTDEETVTFTWTQDETAPTITPNSNFVAVVDGGCNPGIVDLPPINPGLFDAADDCTNVRVVHGGDTLTTNGCTGMVLRTYLAIDGCGNEAAVTQTITFLTDTAAPQPVVTPAWLDLGCNPGPIPDLVVAGLVNNCGGAPDTIELSEETRTNDGCRVTLVRRYAVTDACGNTGYAEQTLTYIEDTTDPVLACPPDADTGCAPPPQPAPSLVTATDDCGIDRVWWVGDTESTAGDLTTVRRTYAAVDHCGNTGMCEQVYTYQADPVPPVIVSAPSGGDLGCNPTGLPQPDTAAVNAIDNIGVDRVEVAFAITNVTGCLGTIAHGYRVVDVCGNFTPLQVAYTYTVDTEAPAINCPAAMEFPRDENCGYTLRDLTENVASDNCGLARVWQEPAPGTRLPLGMTMVAVRAEDNCGRTSTCMVQINVTGGCDPDIAVTKTVYAGHNSGAGCAGAVELVTGTNGSLVTYCFTVENTGDVDLQDVALVDTAIGYSETIGDLPVGAVRGAWREARIAGDLLNTATVSGAPVGPGPQVSDSDTAEVQAEAPPNPALTLTKTVSLDGQCPGEQIVEATNGQTVTWCFRVENTGDIAIDNVQIDDPALGAPLDVTPGTLAPGEFGAASAERVFDGNGVTNIAAAVGTGGGGSVRSPDSGGAAVVPPSSKIAGVVYFDLGGTDPNIENLGVPGVTVQLGFGGGQVDSAVTDDMGRYSFSGLRSAAYQVTYDITTTPGFKSNSVAPVVDVTLAPGQCVDDAHLPVAQDPTAVRLEGFSAAPTEGGIEFAWTSAFEQGTLGFNVLDAEGEPVNSRLILAGETSYSLDAAGLLSGEFTLEEITADLAVHRLATATVIDGTPRGVPTTFVAAEDNRASFRSDGTARSYLVHGFEHPPAVTADGAAVRVQILERPGGYAAYFSVEPGLNIAVE